MRFQWLLNVQLQLRRRNDMDKYGPRTIFYLFFIHSLDCLPLVSTQSYSVPLANNKCNAATYAYKMSCDPFPPLPPSSAPLQFSTYHYAPPGCVGTATTAAVNTFCDPYNDVIFQCELRQGSIQLIRYSCLIPIDCNNLTNCYDLTGPIFPSLEVELTFQRKFI
jgi:hypothetical protein